MPPVLSFVIPTFNRANYLNNLLGTVAAELQGPLGDAVEVLVLDNVSTDNTEEVCRSYPARIRNFRYQRNETNIGAEGNILRCPMVSTGEWVWIFGDDDILHQGSIEKVVSMVKDIDVDVVLLNYRQCDADGETLLTERISQLDRNIQLATLADWLPYPGSFDLIGFISSLVCRRPMLAAVDPTPYRHESYYGHMGTIFEAFGSRPMRFVAEPWLTQRQNNQRFTDVAEEATVLLSAKTGVGLFKVLLEAVKRGHIPADKMWALNQYMKFLDGASYFNTPEYFVHAYFKVPFAMTFGKLDQETSDMVRDFLLNEREYLPPSVQQRIFTLLKIAWEACNVMQKLRDA